MLPLVTSRVSHRGSRAAFTLMEMVVTVFLVSTLLGIAIPALQKSLGRAALQNGRAGVSSALSTARAAATRWGRTSVLRIDAAEDELWTVVDTGAAGAGDTLVLGRIRLREDMGVNLRADRTSLCFNSRGVGTTSRECPRTGATLVLEHGVDVDTLRINSAGRLWR